MSPLEQIAHLADIPLEIEAELDRVVLPVRAILRLRAGSVLPMNRSAGDNIDILIGGALVASGEIVVLEDSMGVRITAFHDQP